MARLSRALRRTKTELEERNEDNGLLQTLFDQVNADWQNGDERRFGIVDWAPKISVQVDGRNYTRDIATFVIEETKLKNFEKNVVDLGALPFFLPCSLAPFHLPSFAISLTNTQPFR